MDTFKAILEMAIPILADLAGPAIAVIAAYLARRLAKFLRFQEDEKLEAFIRSKVDDGITYAEQMGLKFARQRGELPEGSLKLTWALGFVQRELAASGVVDVGAGRIAEMIESRLGDRDGPGDAIAAGDVLRRLHANAPAVLGALLALSVLTGCVNASQPDVVAPRSARTHLASAEAAWEVINAAGVGIDAECTTERLEARGGVGSDFWRRCERSFDTQPALVAAYRKWTFLASTTGLSTDAVFRAFQEFVELYGEVAEMLASFGRPIPPLTEIFQ